MSKNLNSIDLFKTSLLEVIYSSWKEIAGESARLISKEEIDLAHPKEEGHGDYSTTLALRAAKILKRPPLEIADNLKSNIKNQISKMRKLGIEKVEVKAPGFVNFWLTESFFSNELVEVLTKGDDFGKNIISLEKLGLNLKKLSEDINLPQISDIPKVMIEYAHPNTHKEFHIGHLRNITLAESLIRLLENLGVKVIRANYQGDVGMHIAKALWALLQKSNIKNQISKIKETDKRVKLLGEAYVAGNKAYEEDETAKKEIIEINRKIYAKDPSVMPLWKETRQWSLDYFEEIYKRVGSHFDRYYFESEVYEPGKKIVEEHLKNGTFEKSEGAVIFPGEKYGLHNRVFITGAGFPTYEAKDMGLGTLQFKEYNPSLIIHNVGPEQTGYFQVVFKALTQVLPSSIGREMHFIYGWVNLKKGKMSSRSGNVVTGKWLLDEAKKRAGKILAKSEEKYSKEEIEEITEKVAVAAVKYSMLKFSPRSDISFDFDESVSLEGDSGPYLMYTYARTRSVLRRAMDHRSWIIDHRNNLPSTIHHPSSKFNPEELVLLRTIYKFSEVTYEAGVNFAPNLICSYLFDLAHKYNLFYAKHSILTPKEGGEEVKEFRLALTSAVAQVIKNGLTLLGIEVLERM